MLGPRCRFYPSCSALRPRGDPGARCGEGHGARDGPGLPLPPLDAGRRRPRARRRAPGGPSRTSRSRTTPTRAASARPPTPIAPRSRPERCVSLNPLTWLEDDRQLDPRPVPRAAVAVPSATTRGWSWALSIVGLVIVIRIALIPLFVRQIKSQRNMQILQPKIKEIQTEVRGRPRAPEPGDDGALQGDGHQPALELPADPGAGADLLRPVPGARRASPTGSRRRRA